MTDEKPETSNPIVSQHVVLTLPGMRDARIRRGLAYRQADDGPLVFDVYLPPVASERTGAQSRCPVVVLVIGYSDLGARQILGCDLKDLPAYDDWARLIASQGLAAVLYQSYDPAGDTPALIDYLVANADELGLDASAIGVWSCSGNVPNALSLLCERPAIRCAALCYGYTLDLDGRDDVAAAARQFGFVTPAAGRAVTELGPASLLLVRAGLDEMPGLNDSIDRFHAAAQAAGLPVRLIEHPAGPHAFDLFADDETSRQRIRDVLGFLRDELAG